MKIMLVSYQGFDGAGVLHMHYFANQMVRAGHEVLFFLNGSADTVGLVAETPLYDLHEVQFRRGILAPQSRSVIHEFDPDIIHLWTPRHLPARAGLEAWAMTGARLLIHYEDDEQHILKEIGGNRKFSDDDLALYEFCSKETGDPCALEEWTERINWPLVRQTAVKPTKWVWIHPLLTPVVEKIADGFTSISPSYQRLMSEKLGKPSRILYPGVDLRRFGGQAPNRRLVKRLDLQHRAVLLYSGTITNWLDFTSVMKALALLIDEHPEIVLVQIGHNYIADDTDRIANEYGLADHVLFAGPVPHHQMQSYLSLADVFIGTVRCDRFNGHRLPSKLPEYMAMARPILVMDHGVGHEFLDGCEVIKVQGDEPYQIAAGLKSLVLRRHLWPEMGRRLRKKAADLFDWEQNTKNLLAFYSEILAEEQATEPEGIAEPKSPVTIADVSFVPEKPKESLAVRGGEGDKKKVVIVTDGLVGSKMSGTGMRYFELAKVLSRHFSVKLGQKHATDITMDNVVMFQWDPEDPAELMKHTRDADCVLVHGFILEKVPRLREVPGRLVVDLYCPFIFENIEIHGDRGLELDEREQIHQNDLRVLNEQAMAGDYFLCCTARQRDWLLGLLTSVGRLGPRTCQQGITAEDFVAIVPFGLPDAPPQPPNGRVMRGVWPGVGVDDLVLIWGGGLWSWLDPLTVIRAMKVVSQQHSDVKLVFLSTRTAEAVIKMPMLQRAIDLAAELDLIGKSVIFNNSSYIPYAERTHYLSEADIGVCAHEATMETHFAYRTRLLDYLHAGLPMLTSAGDALGDLVDEARLGRALPVADEMSWAEAIIELAEDREEIRLLRVNAAELRELHTWSKIAEPLVDFILRDDKTKRNNPLRLLTCTDRLLMTAPSVDPDSLSLLSDETLHREALRRAYQLCLSEEDTMHLRHESLQLKNENLRLNDENCHLENENLSLLNELARRQRRCEQLEANFKRLTAHAGRLEAKVDLIKRIPLARGLWSLLSRN